MRASANFVLQIQEIALNSKYMCSFHIRHQNFRTHQYHFVTRYINVRMLDCVEKRKIDLFCYVCGTFAVPEHKRIMTETIEEAYKFYFGVSVYRNVPWAPKFTCRTCLVALKAWWDRKRTSLPFAVPMLWSEIEKHTEEDCYACANDIYKVRLNRKKRKAFVYKNVSSATRPIAHSDQYPVPTCPSPSKSTAIISTNLTAGTSSTSGSDVMYTLNDKSTLPSPIGEQRLDTIVRKLHLSQRQSEILISELKKDHVVAPVIKVKRYRKRQEEFLEYFTLTEDGKCVYCNNIEGLVKRLNGTYNADQWRLFIDSSKRSLKAILLYFDNSKHPVPLLYAIEMKETYETMQFILEKISYKDHLWRVMCDLKVVALLTGMQLGYTKHCCFDCMWDSRYVGNQYQKKDWPQRTQRRIGIKNIAHTVLVPPEKILMPPLHIKLGIVKNFVKAINRSASVFQYLCEKFPALSAAKIKEGVFNGPDIRKLMNDNAFNECLDQNELTAWDCVKAVISNFLGKHRVENYRILVDDMMTAFKKSPLICH